MNISPTIAGLLGSLAIVFGALIGVLINASTVRRIQREKRDHLDRGLLRQIRALLTSLSNSVANGVNDSPVRASRWESKYEMLEKRLMRSDVPAALTDAEARAIYTALDALGSTRVALKRIEADHDFELDEAIRRGEIDPRDPWESMWSTDEVGAMKRTYAECCETLVEMWEVLGDRDLIEMLKPVTPKGLAEQRRTEEHHARRGQKKVPGAKS